VHGCARAAACALLPSASGSLPTPAAPPEACLPRVHALRHPYLEARVLAKRCPRHAFPRRPRPRRPPATRRACLTMAGSPLAPSLLLSEGTQPPKKRAFLLLAWARAFAISPSSASTIRAAAAELHPPLSPAAVQPPCPSSRSCLSSHCNALFSSAPTFARFQAAAITTAWLRRATSLTSIPPRRRPSIEP
jgi:hypothetical protein